MLSNDQKKREQLKEAMRSNPDAVVDLILNFTLPDKTCICKDELQTSSVPGLACAWHMSEVIQAIPENAFGQTAMFFLFDCTLLI